MKKISLKKIATVQSGAGFPIKFQGKSDGDFPFAKVGEISRVARQGDLFINNASNWITESISFELKAKIFPKGTIVFAKIGEAIKQNFRAITDRPMLFDNNVMGITPNIAEVNIKYLFFFLKTVDFYQLASKTTLPSIRKSTIESLKIPLPPIAEQKRIAAILDKADAVRRKRREAIRLTEELLRSVFLDMFGDPVTNPMGWDVVKLGSLINSGTVITYGIVQAGEKLEEGIPYIRTSDIKDGVIQEDDLLKTSSKIANKYKRSEVHENDLVISIRATVGTIAKVPATLDGANLTQGTAKISVGEKIDADYLLNFIRSQGCQHWISQQVKGATFREITLKRLREMPIAVPPREQQTIFCKSLKHIETQKQRQLVILQESEDLFNSLLQRAFTGNL